MGTEKFEYNKDNGLIKATDNENRETTVAYKAANTEVSETDQAANTSSFMQYDQFGNQLQQLESWEQEKPDSKSKL